MGQRLVKFSDRDVNAGIRFEPASDEADGVQGHAVEIAEGHEGGADHPLNRLRCWKRTVHAQRLQVSIDADDAARSVDDQLVLHRPRVPGQVHVADAVLRLGQGMPLVEEQVRITAGRAIADVKLFDRPDKGFEQVQSVDPEILKRIPATVEGSGHRSAGIRRVVRVAEEVRREHLADGPGFEPDQGP